MPPASLPLPTRRRSLTAAERRLLEKRRSEANEGPPTGWGGGALVGAGCLAPLWLLTLVFVSDLSWQVLTLFWFGVWVALSLSMWPTSGKAREVWTRRARLLSGALARDEADELRLRVRRVAAIEEPDDLGTRWVFELEDGNLAFLEGQDFVPDPWFPCEELTLVNVLGEEDAPVVDFQRRRGPHLEPERELSADQAADLRFPPNLHFLPGRLEDLETLLRAPTGAE